MSVLELSLSEVSQQLTERKLDSVTVTKACLSQIANADPQVQAFLHVDSEGALAAAAASDARRASGQSRGPLDGIPLALKDNLVTVDMPSTAGSKMLAGYRSPVDATVVSRMKTAGAVVLGKANLDEFGMGSSTENSAFQKTKNPYSLAHIPGGSSGGCAAALAARMCFGALGSDTGGSIRQPAGFTNSVGVKPTYGRVSRHGLIAFASSLDQIGPMARTVTDAALLLEVISGFDSADSTSVNREVPAYSKKLTRDLQGLKIGLPRELMVDGMHPEVRARIESAAQILTSRGATIIDVTLPHAKYALAAYYVIAPAEASSNLARYDGIRYGHRTSDSRNLAELYAKSRAEGFGSEVKRRIMLGAFALSAGYADAYYGKAQAMRTRIRADFETAFEQVDALISPTAPVPPWKLGEKIDDPLAMYLTDVMTLPVNLAGLPAMSVPCGFVDNDSLPVGLQIIGRHFDEQTMLNIGFALESETQFAKRAPPLSTTGAR